MRLILSTTALVSLGILSALSLPAHAQFAPGSIDMANDPAQIEARAPALEDEIVDTPAPSATGGITTDPCPEPKRALASTPDDLAKIQEDITRFTLCVQRAQLLERLNELAEANIETIDTSLNLVVPNAATDDGNAVPGIMPDVPMPQLPDSVSQLLESDDSADIGNDTAQTFENRPTQSAGARSIWRIRDIQGTGGAVHARLEDGSGTLIKITKGENLPDDGGKVTSLSNAGVVVTVDGETQNLRWVE